MEESLASPPQENLSTRAGALRMAAILWLIAYASHAAAATLMVLTTAAGAGGPRWHLLPYSLNAPSIVRVTGWLPFWLHLPILDKVLVTASFGAAVAWAISCGLQGSLRRRDGTTDAGSIALARAVSIGGFAILILAIPAQFIADREMLGNRWFLLEDVLLLLEAALGVAVAAHLRALVQSEGDARLRWLIDPLLWVAVGYALALAGLWFVPSGADGYTITIFIRVGAVATGVAFVLVMLRIVRITPTPDEPPTPASA